ncbi:hypothetical protein K458DRAFT_103290 [Lentithecium fluviatile CBS 122367]|uniref:Uncharacterized protein n=1 Tax=Lentithecium fluviatile CBS 122367 TaxID=1168545 RepID=A0A6G1JIP2_9PLEO|nr:hypothetical protein K458DRAFT_103290 [Lentithecium fluviatile CBS 122367]
MRNWTRSSISSHRKQITHLSPYKHPQRSSCRTTIWGPNPHAMSPSKPTTSPIRVPDRSTRSSPGLRWTYHAHESIGRIKAPAYSTSDYRDDGFRLPDQLSSLSPTFGPRRGIVPVGTVERRRSGVLFNHSCPSGTPEGTEDKVGPSGYFGDTAADVNIPRPARRSRDTVRRVLWEAARVKIEWNFNDWVDRLGAAAGKEGIEETWRQVVKLLNDTLAFSTSKT